MDRQWIGAFWMLSVLFASSLQAEPAGIVSEADARERTIPPEVLKQYCPEVLSGRRPVYAVIRQKDILALRERPKFHADLVRLDFDPESVSSVQRDILLKWVASGHNSVLLIGEDLRKYGPLLGLFQQGHEIEPGDISTKAGLRVLAYSCVGADAGSVAVKGEAAGPGVYSGNCSVYCYAVNTGLTANVTPVAFYAQGLAGAGLYEVGAGKVYFFPEGPMTGGDAERFRLNFLQWMLGLPVPGPADTGAPQRRGEAPPCKGKPERPLRQDQLDIILMQNGDTVMGTVRNDSFRIQTPYAQLEFGTSRVNTITFKPAAGNLDVLTLRNGGRFSGTVRTSEVVVRLPAGGEAKLPKARIKEILFRTTSGKH